MTGKVNMTLQDRTPKISAVAVLFLPMLLMGCNHQKADLRLAPLEADATFFDKLPVDLNESVKMECFAYDPWSCNIAAQYRNRFARHWTTDRTDIGLEDPAPYVGFMIVTQSEQQRPKGAIALSGALSECCSIKAGFLTNPSLKSNEFAVVVGRTP